MIMYFRIARRLLRYRDYELRFSVHSIPARTSIIDRALLTKRFLCDASTRSPEEANKFNKEGDVSKDLHSVTDPQAECSTSSPYDYDEEPDEFVDEEQNDEIFSVDCEAITGNDPQKVEVLKSILKDIRKLRARKRSFLPNKISLEKWKELLNYKTFHERKSFLWHLHILERKERIEQTRKAASKKQKLPVTNEMRMTQTNSPLVYSLHENSIMFRKYNHSMKVYYNYRLALAEWFGPHLIVDCGYESLMNMKERHHCTAQLMYGWTNNRYQPIPFDLIFCNVEEDSAVYKKFHQMIPKVGSVESPVNLTNKHYTDLFPAEKLIYLSPHSENVMKEYDSDAVYIIGAFVDERIHPPVSQEKALHDGIRTAKFPIEEHLHWCQGSQLLAINQCIQILNGLHEGLPWEDALACIGKKKLHYVGMNFRDKAKLDPKSVRHLRVYQKIEMQKELRKSTVCGV